MLWHADKRMCWPPPPLRPRERGRERKRKLFMTSHFCRGKHISVMTDNWRATTLRCFITGWCCHGLSWKRLSSLAAVSPNTNTNGLLLRLLLIVPAWHTTGLWQFVRCSIFFLTYSRASLIRIKRSLSFFIIKDREKKEGREVRKNQRKKVLCH